MKKTIGIVVVIALLWLGAYYFNLQTGQTGEKESATKKVEELPRVDFKAPEFSLGSLDGNHYSLKQAKGKPVMINFWASWCGPCKSEAPELAKLYQKYKGEFELYAVDLTSTESSQRDVENFADSFGYKFPILLDTEGNVSDKYLIKPIPTTYFINKNGIIVDKILGYGGKGALTAKLKDLLAESGGK